MSKNEKHAKDFLIGAMIGSTLGALTAMMFGTKKGHQIQKDMTEKYHEFEKIMKGYVHGKRKKIKHQVQKIAKKAKSKLRSAKRSIKK
jgi:gas vesicle protein